jgi:ribose transport system ATP-binding protein
VGPGPTSRCPTVPQGETMTNRLDVRNLSKTFSGTQVLHHVSFDLRAGEIHALVGENGCGKSTFIKCLSGYHAPDHGAEIILDGEAIQVPFDSSKALELGFSFIHQDPGLVPTLSVKENIALSRGFRTTAGWRIDWALERRLAREAMTAIGVDIDPDAKVSDISQADRTMVAIARAFARSEYAGKVLVLDEPTATLPEADVAKLFSALRRIAAGGVSMIYVSHRLQEILQIADRVTAFRDGRKVDTADVSNLDEDRLVQMIIGRSLDTFYPDVASRPAPQSLLEVRDLQARDGRSVSFSVGKGEIVGLAGLLGSGRSEIARLLFGLQRPIVGNVTLDGKNALARSAADALTSKICLVPEDRLNQGGFRQMSVAENMSLPDLSEFWKAGWLNVVAERRAMQKWSDAFKVRPKDVSTQFRKLSGGNQQKAIIARALRLEPKLLILDEPVQGVDIGAKAEIYGFIEDAAKHGMGVLLIDSDFEDLARLCHRVLVVRDGRIVAELFGQSLTRAHILELVFAEETTSGKRTETVERAEA